MLQKEKPEIVKPFVINLKEQGPTLCILEDYQILQGNKQRLVVKDFGFRKKTGFKGKRENRKRFAEKHYMIINENEKCITPDLAGCERQIIWIFPSNPSELHGVLAGTPFGDLYTKFQAIRQGENEKVKILETKMKAIMTTLDTVAWGELTHDNLITLKKVESIAKEGMEKEYLPTPSKTPIPKAK